LWAVVDGGRVPASHWRHASGARDQTWTGGCNAVGVGGMYGGHYAKVRHPHAVEAITDRPCGERGFCKWSVDDTAGDEGLARLQR
jgi:hypothetical protein